jgi:hypothetical protein
MTPASAQASPSVRRLARGACPSRGMGANRGAQVIHAGHQNIDEGPFKRWSQCRGQLFMIPYLD